MIYRIIAAVSCSMVLVTVTPVVADDNPKRIHIEKHASTHPELNGMSREERHEFWKQKREERLANMTPEEREAWEKRHQAHREKWQNMSAEERQAYRKKRQEMRRKIRSMSPEERREFRKQKREERLANMTPEERARWDEKRRARIEKWNNMTEADKETMRKRWQQYQPGDGEDR